MDEVTSTDNLIKLTQEGRILTESEFPVIYTCHDKATRKRINSALILQDLVKMKIKTLDKIGTELFNEGNHDRDIDYLESELDELVRKSEQ